LVLVLVLGACTHAATDAHPVASGDHAARVDEPECPAAIPGTSVTVEASDAGAELVFVTTGDVAELRRRAHVWSQAEMVRGRFTITARDIDGGVRLIYVPFEPSELAALQSELRMHAHHLAGGTCKMAM
jgi:hypothetical protein